MAWADSGDHAPVQILVLAGRSGDRDIGVHIHVLDPGDGLERGLVGLLHQPLLFGLIPGRLDQAPYSSRT